MVATRWPALSNATATCRAVVDFPEPPFSLPSTTTCAEPDCPWLVCTNIFSDPCGYLQITGARGQAKCAIRPSNRLTVWLNHESDGAAGALDIAGLRGDSSQRPRGIRPRGRRLGGGAPALVGSRPPPFALTDPAVMSRSPMIVRTLPALRRALDRQRAKNTTIALVPTIGALHDGHVPLVRLAIPR